MRLLKRGELVQREEVKLEVERKGGFLKEVNLYNGFKGVTFIRGEQRNNKDRRRRGSNLRKSKREGE